jgi:hypothetical protein
MAYDGKLDRESLAKIKMLVAMASCQIRSSIQQNCSGRSEIRIAKALIFAWVTLTLLGEHAVSADGLITMRSNLGPE